MNNYCIICNSLCYENNPLTNGKSFHNKCYEDLLLQERTCYKKLSENRSIIYSIEVNERKLFTRIKAYFGNDITSKTEHRKYELSREIDKLNKDLEKINSLLKSLYDYWSERPPDWEERRKNFIEQKPFCEECFSDYSDKVILQVHHIIPISKGGSHKQDNLKVLCKSCHQSKHPYNDFNVNSTSHINPFKEKIKVLDGAIKNGHIVSFNYTKWEGEKSSRRIKPQGFKLVGKTLCVYGFCFLRQDKRTFAIKRINKLKIS